MPVDLEPQDWNKLLVAKARSRLRRFTDGARNPKVRRRWLKRLALGALIALVAGPILLILPLWLFDPPITAMMMSRTIDRVAAGKTPYVPRRTVVPIEKVSRDLRRAVLAAEDDAFYLHHGFDLKQIEKALTEKRGRVRGASTITQQTAKNLFLWSGRSLIRKGFEAYFTFWLELLLSKDRILEIYLNLAECADGYFGVEACSRYWFKKPAAAMGPEESARLAAIFPSPRKRSPFGDYAGSQIGSILERMSIPVQRE